MNETPDLSRPYCPQCEPEADVLGEILAVRWCWSHSPSSAGADDAAVPVSILGSSNGFDAETNRRVCALLAGRGGAG